MRKIHERGKAQRVLRSLQVCLGRAVSWHRQDCNR